MLHTMHKTELNTIFTNVSLATFGWKDIFSTNGLFLTQLCYFQHIILFCIPAQIEYNCALPPHFWSCQFTVTVIKSAGGPAQNFSLLIFLTWRNLCICGEKSDFEVYLPEAWYICRTRPRRMVPKPAHSGYESWLQSVWDVGRHLRQYSFVVDAFAAPGTCKQLIPQINVVCGGAQ